ncbi:MAG: LamG domain-containing protein, partial [Polyangiaceae bacterium]
GCFVPYGCTTYVCAVSPDGGMDAGDASVGTVVTGALPAAGPRAAAGDAGAADGGSGADEAYSFVSGNTITGTGVAGSLPQGGADRTVMLWEKEATNPGSATFFNYGSYTSNERCGLLAGGSHDYFVGENNDVRGNIVLDDDKWHHFAVTYSSRVIGLYVDGVQDKQMTLSTALNTTGQRWAIGTTVTVANREPLIGSVSDIRVYNRVLSTTEIANAATFTGASANPESLRASTSGLVFWLPLFATPEAEFNRCGP